MTLGGGEVRLLNLVAAYGAFANGGKRVVPFGISRVETLDGTQIADSKWQIADDPGHQLSAISDQPILDPRVAYLITDILSDNIARIPSFGEGSALEIGRPAAAKTGTTSDWRDNWTAGYTPDLVAGVWVGNADNTPMLDVSGISGAGPIWHDFMKAVLRDVPPAEFPRPEGLVRVEVCADSGLLPSAIGHQPSAVSHQPSAISYQPCSTHRYEWFIAGTEPTQVDTMHRQIAMDVRTGQPADATTPPEFVTAETVWALPEEYQTWARENGIPQPPAVEGDRTSAGRLASSFQHPASSFQLPASNLQLTSPDSNRVYRLDPGLPPSAQKLPITAQPGPEVAPDATVTLLLDGAPFAQVAGPEYTAWWPMNRGRHVWAAVVTGPDGGQVESEPVVVTVE